MREREQASRERHLIRNDTLTQQQQPLHIERVLLPRAHEVWFGQGRGGVGDGGVYLLSL